MGGTAATELLRKCTSTRTVGIDLSSLSVGYALLRKRIKIEQHKRVEYQECNSKQERERERERLNVQTDCIITMNNNQHSTGLQSQFIY